MSAPVEQALDAAVRKHFEDLHEAGVCVPFDKIGETSRRVVRNQLRGVVTAAVLAVLPDPDACTCDVPCPLAAEPRP